MVRLTCLSLLALCAGCVGPFVPCSSEIGNFAVIVAVVDSTTGGPPGSRPMLVVSDGAFVDTAFGPAPGERPVSAIAAAAERAGTYSLTATADGYRPWRRDGVQVRRGGSCGDIQTVRPTARLQAGTEPFANRRRDSDTPTPLR